jgi:hypothetical protein
MVVAMVAWTSGMLAPVMSMSPTGFSRMNVPPGSSAYLRSARIAFFTPWA